MLPTIHNIPAVELYSIYQRMCLILCWGVRMRKDISSFVFFIQTMIHIYFTFFQPFAGFYFLFLLNFVIFTDDMGLLFKLTCRRFLLEGMAVGELMDSDLTCCWSKLLLELLKCSNFKDANMRSSIFKDVAERIHVLCQILLLRIRIWLYIYLCVKIWIGE